MHHRTPCEEKSLSESGEHAGEDGINRADLMMVRQTVIRAILVRILLRRGLCNGLSIEHGEGGTSAHDQTRDSRTADEHRDEGGEPAYRSSILLLKL